MKNIITKSINPLLVVCGVVVAALAYFLEPILIYITSNIRLSKQTPYCLNVPTGKIVGPTHTDPPPIEQGYFLYYHISPSWFPATQIFVYPNGKYIVKDDPSAQGFGVNPLWFGLKVAVGGGGFSSGYVYSGILTKEELRQLIKTILTNKFFDLPAKFNSSDATDGANLSLTITLNGKTNSVSGYNYNIDSFQGIVKLLNEYRFRKGTEEKEYGNRSGCGEWKWLWET